MLTLIDGRNRREACKRAGAVPATTMLDGQDPIAYVVSTNIARRNLTKSQQAMLMAMIYPEGEKGGRSLAGRKSRAIRAPRKTAVRPPGRVFNAERRC